MTRRTTFLVLLTLILAFSFLIRSDSKANAQTQTYVADTGVFNLAPGQILRISGDGVASEVITVRFRRMEYVDTSSTGGIVRKQLASQVTTSPITVASDQASSFDIVASASGVRGQLLSSSKNLKVNAVVISPASGQSCCPLEQVSFNFTNTL